MSFESYPFDHQLCRVRLTSPVLTSDQLILQLHNFTHNTYLPQRLLHYEISYPNIYYSDVEEVDGIPEMSVVGFDIKLERRFKNMKKNRSLIILSSENLNVLNKFSQKSKTWFSEKDFLL